MRLHKFLLSILIILTAVMVSKAQVCNCENTFEWVKKTFEENDAGFQYVIDKKGFAEYEKHNTIFFEKVKVAQKNSECADLLNEWLFFFRKGHIGIVVLENDTVEEQTHLAVQSFPDWQKIDIDTFEFKKYLKNKKKYDIEGIWRIGNDYVIGIQKIENEYIGFIIKTDIKEWKKGEVKLKIIHEGNATKSIYYMRDHTADNNIDCVKMIGKNILEIGDFTLVRLFPKTEEDMQVEQYFKIKNAKEPYLEQIKGNTLFLRIPSFLGDNKQLIDSVLEENYAKIISTRNLILDLRDNGGGDDIAWQQLIPIIYTNPIRQKSCYFWSSEMNNQKLKEYRGDDFYKEINHNLGSFFLLFAKKYFINNLPDTVHKFPENVAILVNKSCASSTEQFLLAAKQSSKVKIFGTLTSGFLDFSNLNMVDSPCGNFKLYYAMSKGVDLEDYPIDNTGIQPDYYLDDEIPEYQWIDYVSNILNNYF